MFLRFLILELGEGERATDCLMFLTGVRSAHYILRLRLPSREKEARKSDRFNIFLYNRKIDGFGWATDLQYQHFTGKGIRFLENFLENSFYNIPLGIEYS